MTLEILALVTFTINILFGFWRAFQRFFSLKWFLAIHIPIIIIIILRFVSDVGFKPITFLYIVPAYIFGQWTGRIIGGIVRRRIRRKQRKEVNVK
jgi:hypothetical protein